jgi:hypothetical protein
MEKPRIFIEYYEKNELVKLGAFYSISPDGHSNVIGQEWTAYRVIDKLGNAKRIIIPNKYHRITSGA